jgi:hypothetical protein
LDSRTRTRAPIADGIYLVGGGALFASAFVHWVTHGPGSASTGHKLIDEIVALGKHVPALSAARLTVFWYLLPALGAIGWIVIGLRGANSWWARGVGIAAFVFAFLVVLAFQQLVTIHRFSWGPWLAVLGGFLMFASSMLTLAYDRMRGRARSSVVRAGDS